MVVSIIVLMIMMMAGVLVVLKVLLVLKVLMVLKALVCLVELRMRQVLHLLRSEGGLASLEDAGHLLSYSLSSDLTMLSL